MRWPARVKASSAMRRGRSSEIGPRASTAASARRRRSARPTQRPGPFCLSGEARASASAAHS
eukprot:415763-Prymnesium_polylepis.1